MRKVDSSNQRIKELEKTISERKKYISSQYKETVVKTKTKCVQKEIDARKKKARCLVDIDLICRFLYIAYPILAGATTIAFIILDCFIVESGTYGRFMFIPIFGWPLLALLTKIVSLIIQDAIDRKADKIELQFSHKLQKAKEEDEKATIEAEKTRSNKIADNIANDTAIKQYYQEIKQCEMVLALCNANINKNDVLSEQDKKLDAVSYILGQLKSRRADSVKEALLQYDGYRRQRSRDLIAQMEREERREAEKKREIQESIARTQQMIDDVRRIEREKRIDEENKALRKDIEDIKRSLDR